MAILDQMGEVPSDEFKAFLGVPENAPEDKLETGEESAPDSVSADEMSELPEDMEDEPYQAAKYSPFPALRNVEYDPNNPNRTLTESDSRESGIYVVRLYDWDETLWKSKSKFRIMLIDFAMYLKDEPQIQEKFIEKGGNMRFLQDLIDLGHKWETQRTLSNQGVKIERIREELNMAGDEKLLEYEDALVQCENLSALAFKGMKVKELEEFGEGFMESGRAGELFPYAKKITQYDRDHGIEPVVCTGAPDFLMPGILKVSGLKYGKGMTYLLDEEGRIVGVVPRKKGNMGLADQKDDYAKELTRRKYAIGGGMGNSVGDMGLISAGASKDRAKEDLHGGGLFTNVSNSAKPELKRAYARHLKDGRVIMVDPEDFDTVEKQYEAVVAAHRRNVHKLFEPALTHLTDEEKEKVLQGVKDRHERGRKHPNLENLKRMRDALKDMELPQDEIKEALLVHYPPIVVDDVMKLNMLNTNDPKATSDFIEGRPDLVDLKEREQLEAVLALTSMTPEQIKKHVDEVMASKLVRRFIGLQPKRRTTPPPMPAIVPEETQSTGDRKLETGELNDSCEQE